MPVLLRETVLVEQAVILAGGLGTRLGLLTRATPKPLLPIAGQPFLSLLVRELQRYGLDVVIVAGFEGRQIADQFENREGVRVLIEPAPLGTAGALRFAIASLAERFLLLNGDSLFDFNVLDLDCVPGAASAGAVMAVRHVEDAGRYGAVHMVGHRIESFAERSLDCNPGLINGGVSILARDVIAELPEGAALSIERDVYPVLAAQGRLLGRCYAGAFIDIGIPDDYTRAQHLIPRILRRGAITFDRDGVLNEDVGYAHRPDQIRWIPGAIEAVKMVNDAGLFAFVATNQAGVARGFYEEQHVIQLHAWMNRELRRHGAHIDAFAYSPFHPEGTVERYRRTTDCRKPGPKMLLDLMAGHEADARRIVMIGDKQSDIAAAEAAGVQGILYSGGDLRDALAPVISRLTQAEE